MNDSSKPKHLLITGGTRSGKSKFAEEQAALLDDQVIYLATAEVLDQEMKERVALHKQRRPSGWQTVEASLEIIQVFQQYQRGYTILLDCLTMYLSNLYFSLEKTVPTEELAVTIHQKVNQLAEMVFQSTSNIVIVTNELGWGVVPENQLARIFRDLAGLANQRIAEVCDEVYLVVSGIPVKIKGGSNVAKS